MCSKEQQTSDNLIVKDNCFIIEISDKCSFSAIHRAVYTGLDRFGIGPRLDPGRPCVHTGPLGTGTVKATYPVQTGSTCEKGPGTDLDRSRSRVNEKNRSHFGLN